jgi:hypothetical protein
MSFEKDINIIKALNSAPDLSDVFIQKVKYAGDKIAHTFGCNIEYEQDDNYNFCRILLYSYNDFASRYNKKADVNIQPNILISNKGNFFTIVYYTVKGNSQYFVHTPRQQFPCIICFEEEIIPFIENMNYVYLAPDATREHIVPDRYTALDNAPATLFDVIFGELV